MSDYDNKNKGAAFAPFSDQKFILSGNLDVQGIEKRCVYIAGQTKNNKKIIKIYQEIGVMFDNQSDNEKAPNYTGTLQDHLGEEMKVAAWKRVQENTGNNYLNISLSEKLESGQNNSDPLQSNNKSDPLGDGDDIPF
tara:strand:+ start:292 stop:702 length:411 start_codon:yes stop_codon:yes gene_type:complete